MHLSSARFFITARQGRGKTKGEQLRDRDALLGEESQDHEGDDDGGA